MFAGLTGVHLLVIAAVIVLMFGAKKLPIFAKSLGQTVKVLRSELGPEAKPEPVVVETPAATSPR